MPELPTQHLTALSDGIILTGEAAVEGHALLLRDGKILDIVGNGKIPSDAQRVACPGLLLAPGLIDAQVNGGDNILFNDRPDTAGVLAIAAAHLRHGTTSLLPTVITDRPEVTQQAIDAVRGARVQDSGVLGIHIEGPHLSHERRGVHSEIFLRQAGESDSALYYRADDEVMLLTVAPEAVDPATIAKLRSQGVIISLGHTAAAPDDVRAALQAGATGFTHLFNGMGGMEARKPGVSGIALDDRASWCGLIADGHHVADEMIRLALRAKPPGKVFLVSDAMPPAAGAEPKSFSLYGKPISVADGQCHDGDGRFAGSALTLADCVRYCVQHVGIALEEALRMASAYPAAFLGVGKTRGRLLPGYRADIVAFDEQLVLKDVFTR